MDLKNLFLKQCPELTVEQAKEAEGTLLRYFELLYKYNKEQNKHDKK